MIADGAPPGKQINSKVYVHTNCTKKAPENVPSKSLSLYGCMGESWTGHRVVCSLQDCRSWRRHSHAEPGPGTQETQVRAPGIGEPLALCSKQQQGEEGLAYAGKRLLGSTRPCIRDSSAHMHAPVKSRQVRML